MLKKLIKIFLSIIIIALMVAGLYFLSLYNYLLFHFIIEFASIVIGICVFLIAVHTSYLTKNVFMVFLGASLLTSSLLDFLHTLSFKGMNIFVGFDSDLPAQLWLSARFVQVIGIAIAAFLISKILTNKLTLFISLFYSLIFIGFILTIFVFEVFPASFVEGYGLTDFKKIAEYVMSAIALGAIFIYFFKREQIGKRNFYLIAYSLAFFILSELSFTLYIDVYGFFNMLGHIFKLASYYFIYRFFIASNLRDPFKILFNNLKRTNEKLAYVASHDGLTGLLNQAAVFEAMKKQFHIAKRFQKPFSVIILDIDDFKNINDRYGHPVGDVALKHLASIIASTVREVDIKGRYGGDEFLISPLEADTAMAVSIAQKIQENLNNAPKPENALFDRFNISLGVSGIKEDIEFDEIIIQAYKALLKSKEAGKNRVTLLR